MKRMRFCFSACLPVLLLVSCMQQGAREVNAADMQTALSQPSAFEELPFPATAEEAINRLLEGNGRFVHNETTTARNTKSHAAAGRRKPFAALVSCGGGPWKEETVFDQMPGDLFVVRGGTDAASGPLASQLQYAVDELGVKAVVLLGHEYCAVHDAAQSKTGGLAGADQHQLAHAFVQKGLKQLRTALAGSKQSREVAVVGAVLHTGSKKIKLVDERSAVLP